MVVGILEVRIALRQCRSLKDKRRVVNSLKDRLRNSFNVSVAEVGAQDAYHSAVLAVAQVSTDGRYVRGALEHALKLMRQCRDAELVQHSIELVRP